LLKARPLRATTPAAESSAQILRLRDPYGVELAHTCDRRLLTFILIDVHAVGGEAVPERDCADALPAGLLHGKRSASARANHLALVRAKTSTMPRIIPPSGPAASEEPSVVRTIAPAGHRCALDRGRDDDVHPGGAWQFPQLGLPLLLAA